MKFILLLFILVLPVLTKAQNKPLKTKEQIREEASIIWVQAKIKAADKDLVKDLSSYINKDTTFDRLKIDNPDSALLYAKHIMGMVEAGTINSWPPKLGGKSIPDSVVKKEEKIAYGAIRFGITEETYYKLPESKRPYSDKIGNERYYLALSFDNENRLYLVAFSSSPEKAADYDSKVKNAVDNLIVGNTKKYGRPNVIQEFPSLDMLDPGYIRWMREWSIGLKKIKLGVYEVESGAGYNAICWIYDKELYNLNLDANRAKRLKKQ